MIEPAFEIPEEVLQSNPRLREDWEQQEKIDEKETALRSTKTDKEKEQKSIKQLLEEGSEFYCPTILRRIIGIKQSKWEIKPMAASTMVRLCREYLEITVDEQSVESQGVIEAKNLVVEHGERMARIVAISVVGATPFVGWILRPILTKYFYNRMTPEALVQHSIRVNDYKSFVDFLTSIRLTQGKRLTQPTLIEESDSKKG